MELGICSVHCRLPGPDRGEQRGPTLLPHPPAPRGINMLCLKIKWDKNTPQKDGYTDCMMRFLHVSSYNPPPPPKKIAPLNKNSQTYVLNRKKKWLKMAI